MRNLRPSTFLYNNPAYRVYIREAWLYLLVHRINSSPVANHCRATRWDIWTLPTGRRYPKQYETSEVSK